MGVFIFSGGFKPFFFFFLSTPDYSQLRVGGLIMAAVLCLIGICILFSNHCRCKFKQDNRKRANGTAATTEQLLSSPARASEC
ncbi:phospholemman-like isoform X1 [Acipenser oxyrinchus oxyrinchus]|uniref:FXYD domain-containing ion transport regulator n=1 Tax=Acipenser oxyrinchus oxyrinchus TaxID=40147 RepID=A0AAD8CIP8_ACIOX|nr:phospholemman-like isoform X1 [Acipenser oxyrinchus oxyrinchus]